MKSRPSYETSCGAAYCGDSLDLIGELEDDSVSLIFTSPPFALQRKKEYGNPDQDGYVEWLASFARKLLPKLRMDGSFVLDLGGAYRKGFPIRSLHNFKIPIHLCEDAGFFLAEDFYWFNSSKLPSPIEWVNKRKIRAKDSVDTVWWFSRTAWPKADVSRVLTPYSTRMKKLLANPEGFYKPKKRPSGHDIGTAFAVDNGGAIPSNLLSIPNSESNSPYLAACKRLGLEAHPARFPPRLPEFFIRMLTDPGDLVVDIFAGSNTTGMVADHEGRTWMAFEIDRGYLAASTFRFLSPDEPDARFRAVHERVLLGRPVSLPSGRLIRSGRRG